MPWLSVSPDGTIHIVFCDRRDDPKDKQFNLYYTYSDDEGVSFKPNIKLTEEASTPSSWFGDLTSLTSTVGKVYAVWTDTRGCNGVDNCYSLYVSARNYPTEQASETTEGTTSEAAGATTGMVEATEHSTTPLATSTAGMGTNSLLGIAAVIIAASIAAFFALRKKKGISA